MEVGFLGLGIMGNAMATNLLRHGFRVTVWNQTLYKCQELVALGATVGEPPASVISKCKYTIAMLSDPSAALSVVFDKDGVLEQIGNGKGYVDMSTVDATASTKISEMMQGNIWAILDGQELPESMTLVLRFQLQSPHSSSSLGGSFERQYASPSCQMTGLKVLLIDED